MSIRKSNTLPRNLEQKKQLLDKLTNAIVNLESDIRQNSEDIRLVIKCQEDVETFRLRQRLIAKCGQLSLMRLSHLQEIFKHYCTHIFKTGKHMTFERLQYEKVHMTMERFFLFLKDFKLTVANIDAKDRQVIDKQNIITTFKKVSSNARELSFEEFIRVIQKLAILYWDEKMNYHQKKKEYELRMKRIKKENQKRKKKKMGLQASESQNQKSKEEEGQKVDGQQSQQQQQNEEEKSMQKSKVNNELKPEPENENDDLINDLMKNGDIEDPNEQVKAVAEKAKRENEAVESIRKIQKEDFQSMLQLSNQQKIQFYYQLLGIDSIDSYKRKLTELNLSNYIVHRKKNEDNNVKALSESKLQAAMQHEEQRLHKLKAKMNEKKQKFKDRPLPKPSNEQAKKEEQNSKRRRQMKKEREKAVKEFQVDQVKKKEEKMKKGTPIVQYREGEVTLQMLEKLTLDHLKLKNFNPSKYYTIDEEDKYFLDEYGGSRPRFSQRFQNRQRQSMSIVEGTKMRAKQIEKKEKQSHNRQNSSLSRNRI